MATKKKGRGRPKVPDPIRIKYVYITGTQEKRILKKHKNLSNALKSIALES